MSKRRQHEMAIGSKASRSHALGDEQSVEQQRRKGAFLVRQFGNPQGRLLDVHGRSTRLALSARDWGEPVPKNAAAAKRLAKKGEVLLARLRRSEKGEKR